MAQIGLFTDLNEHHSSGIPDGSEVAALVRGTPARVDRISFAKTVADNVDTSWGSLLNLGAGQTVNQTGGALVVTTGRTINSETIIRGNKSYGGSGLRMRAQVMLSTRQSNQQFFVELVDVVADNVAATIINPTTITVTIPNNPFTSANVGQSMYLGGYVGTGTFVPNKYTIDSVAGNVVTYTGSSLAAGSGTVRVFGWSYYHILYDGTGNTYSKFDTQRYGWSSGDTQSAGNSTSSPGHIIVMTANDLQAGLMDASVNGAITNHLAQRTSNVPDDVNVVVQIRAVNGTVAPGATATMTVGFVSVTEFSPLDTVLQDVRPLPRYSATPSILVSGSTTGVTGAVTVSGSSSTSPVYIHPANFGGAYSLTTAASTNAASIKSSAGNLSELSISNPTATAAFVKLYNKASVPTVGTDVPIMTVRVAPSGSSGDIVALDFGVGGKRFTTGIAIAVTANAVATDTTSAVAGVQIHGTFI